MPYLTEFITVAAIHLLGAMSPGPDFALISRNSLVYSRKAGVYTAIGLALGILIHVSYSLIGIGLIISKSILLFSIIKYLGAAYLIYLGYKAIRTKRNSFYLNNQKINNNLGKLEAVKIGFVANILNPKVTLFFLALFTQVINPETPLLIQVLYGLEMSVMTFCWFAFLSTILSHRIIKNKFSSGQHYLEKTFGAILIALGIKVALSGSK